MTPKEIKKKYPGYNIRSSKSKTNNYNLYILYKQNLFNDAIGSYYGDCILIINGKEKGRWNNIKKHDKPSAIMWNNNDNKFVILALNLSSKQKKDGVINNGKFTTMPYQFDINKYIMRFVGESTADIAAGRTKLNLYYPLLKKGMFVYNYDSTTRIALFGYEAPGVHKYNKIGPLGLYSIKQGKTIIPAIFNYISKITNGYEFNFDGNHEFSVPYKDILNFGSKEKHEFLMNLFKE